MVVASSWWLLPRVRGIWENVRQFILRLCFFLSFFFFFRVEISSRTLIPLFRQDQSTVVQRAEMIVTERSLMSCVRVRFLTGSHTMP